MNDITNATETLDTCRFRGGVANEHVADIVERLNAVPPETASALLLSMPLERAAEVLDESGLEHAAELLVAQPVTRAIELLKAISADRRAEIFRHLEAPSRAHKVAQVTRRLARLDAKLDADCESGERVEHVVSARYREGHSRHLLARAQGNIIAAAVSVGGNCRGSP